MIKPLNLANVTSNDAETQELEKAKLTPSFGFEDSFRKKKKKLQDSLSVSFRYLSLEKI